MILLKITQDLYIFINILSMTLAWKNLKLIGILYLSLHWKSPILVKWGDFLGYVSGSSQSLGIARYKIGCQMNWPNQGQLDYKFKSGGNIWIQF